MTDSGGRACVRLGTCSQLNSRSITRALSVGYLMLFRGQLFPSGCDSYVQTTTIDS
uniref:Uncharacterized protein n=1 Tax=Utricularia reniformis TaxID=192314 RepID=A0A1Y0B377_9LAMI|nr:hypothetical protein AEK19_MT1679 [Utricularia reniformis]ART31861.1 hypothetical protein AEK19_MT1679 [Utricularia reniformis]